MKQLTKNQQIENCLLALSLWAEVPPRKVVAGLSDWTCGTQACFGGHLATWPEFRAQGVCPTDGSPELRQPGSAEVIGYSHAVSKYLFGSFDLFHSAGHAAADDQLPRNASAHRVVVNRLEHQIQRLQERA